MLVAFPDDEYRVRIVGGLNGISQAPSFQGPRGRCVVPQEFGSERGRKPL